MRRTVRIAALLVLILGLNSTAQTEWPKEIETSKGTVVIYQPQPEDLDGNRLDARAAVALELKGTEVPLFGAIWFQARLETDRGTRKATILDVSVVRVRFPDEDAQLTLQLKSLLEREIPRWEMEISMDRLMTTLETVEQRIQDAEKLNMKPPKVIFMTEPAILITIDGKPRLKDEEGSKVQRVINTAFTLLFDPSGKTYYLYADEDTWYAARDIKGPWDVTRKVPKEIVKRAPEMDVEETDEQDAEGEQEPGPAPKIIVETEPTELIACTGKPEFAAITGTNLLYLSNTDSDVLLDIESQLYYILLAGRWYVSKNTQGPWEYVPAEDVPEGFAKIPDGNEMETVLYAVPGTDEAKDAVLDAQIPQTASIERKEASLVVEYDGKPKFEKIKGTKMTYAVNTATPVIYCQKRYYACDEAVWFTSMEATGKWVIASSVPDEIYTIPPDCPLYNVTFVRVYGSTPEVVYVGYTPGYTHTYVYGTTVVYGTGYYWPGWYGRYYYPRPCTWGFHVRYSPRWGWSFGFSYCRGPFRFTIGGGPWYRGGWWGPGRYRGYRRGYRHGYRRGYQAGYRAGQHHAQQNVYRSQRNQSRAKPMNSGAQNRDRAGVANSRFNNVYADKNGNVHRRTDQGWESRGRKGWQSTQGQQSRAQAQSQQTQRSQDQRSQQAQQQRQQQQQAQRQQQHRQQQLNQAYQARQRGNQRSQPQRSSGGSRGRR